MSANSIMLLSPLSDVRSFVSEDAALAKRIDEFIQNNMKLIRENKSFLSLPQINIKLLGRYK